VSKELSNWEAYAWSVSLGTGGRYGDSLGANRVVSAVRNHRSGEEQGTNVGGVSPTAGIRIPSYVDGGRGSPGGGGDAHEARKTRRPATPTVRR